VNQSSTRGLVPPRPNLGPEPWSDSQSIATGVVLAVTLFAVLVILFVWRQIRRGRTRRVGRVRSNQSPRDATPRGRLVALSDSIRDALADQFGTTWRAKTIEELSAEVKLEEVLGSEQLRELIRFLDQVDHLKFAPERPNHRHQSLEGELTNWEPRLADLKKRIQAKPRGRVKSPTNNGGGPPNSRIKMGRVANASARSG
jgi:hypothetical protein